MNIGHVAITVKSMEASLDFYTKGLGLKKAFELNRPETGEPWIVYLYMGNEQFLELFYGGEVDYSWKENHRAYNHLCLAVEDIHETVKKLMDAGYKMDKEPRVGCDGNWQSWITDPDGVRLELMQLGEDSPQKKAIREL